MKLDKKGKAPGVSNFNIELDISDIEQLWDLAESTSDTNKIALNAVSFRLAESEDSFVVVDELDLQKELQFPVSDMFMDSESTMGGTLGGFDTSLVSDDSGANSLHSASEIDCGKSHYIPQYQLPVTHREGRQWIRFGDVYAHRAEYVL